MEVKQVTMFTFTTMAEDQGFTFMVAGENRAQACANLLRKLSLVTKELQSMTNTEKSTSAN
jgi:hypothetical protein